MVCSNITQTNWNLYIFLLTLMLSEWAVNIEILLNIFNIKVVLLLAIQSKLLEPFV